MTVPTSACPGHAPVAESTRPVSHPTPCPLWCQHRHEPGQHQYGPTATWHWSHHYQLANPLPDANGDTLLRAELYQSDEDDATGEQRLSVTGESVADLSADEADILIAQMQAFVDTLRVLRRQMGSGQ